MPSPGDVVVVVFPGAVATKSRPAVVVSSASYHAARPDCVLAIVTSNLADANTAFDHVLMDWALAGLHRPSAVRSYFAMAESAGLHVVGALSQRDWRLIRTRLAGVFA